MRTIFGRVHMTREEWLNAAAARLATDFDDVFAEHGKPEIFRNAMYAAGWPSRGGQSKVIGQCWPTSASGVAHVFINPRLGEDIVEVLATLAHEMAHAADDCGSGHKGPFTKMIRKMGLTGKPTATVAGEEFEAWAKSAAAALGPYPHKAITGVNPNLKKQVSRQLKVYAKDCDSCDYVARTTRKWLDDLGAPKCPHGVTMTEA